MISSILTFLSLKCLDCSAQRTGSWASHAWMSQKPFCWKTIYQENFFKTFPPFWTAHSSPQNSCFLHSPTSNTQTVLYVHSLMSYKDLCATIKILNQKPRVHSFRRKPSWTLDLASQKLSGNTTKSPYKQAYYQFK